MNLAGPFPQASRMLICVSGGQDSVALLLCLLEWRRRHNHACVLHVVTFDHMLRSASRLEAHFVKSLANAYGCECDVIKLNVKTDTGNIQNNARKARYNAIDALCVERSAAFVFMGHQQDDQIENYYIRNARKNTSHLGVGIPFVSYYDNYKLIRPLSNISRMKIANIVRNIKHAQDPSNVNPKFIRSAVRKHVAMMTTDDRRDIIRRIRYTESHNIAFNTLGIQPLRRFHVMRNFVIRFSLTTLHRNDCAVSLYYFMPWILGKFAKASTIQTLVSKMLELGRCLHNPDNLPDLRHGAVLHSKCCSYHSWGRCSWTIYDNEIYLYPNHIAVNNALRFTVYSNDGGLLRGHRDFHVDKGFIRVVNNQKIKRGNIYSDRKVSYIGKSFATHFDPPLVNTAPIVQMGDEAQPMMPQGRRFPLDMLSQARFKLPCVKFRNVRFVGGIFCYSLEVKLNINIPQVNSLYYNITTKSFCKYKIQHNLNAYTNVIFPHIYIHNKSELLWIFDVNLQLRAIRIGFEGLRLVSAPMFRI